MVALDLHHHGLENRRDNCTDFTKLSVSLFNHNELRSSGYKYRLIQFDIFSIVNDFLRIAFFQIH